MTKELEALNYLYNTLILTQYLDIVESAKVKSAYEYIKQRLEAIEIINKKNVSIEFLKDCKFDLETYNADFYTENLTQKEIDVLKEVLGNG